MQHFASDNYAGICPEALDALIAANNSGPEFFSGGSKLLTAPGIGGKLTPDAIEAVVTRRADIHYPKPKVVTLTQSTEVGTVYSVEEVRAIAAIAKRRHLNVHMDGARFANAVAAL